MPNPQPPWASDTTTFPNRLRQHLEARQESAASLARAIQVSPQAVAKWLKGGAITYNSLRAVAHYLDVNWVWLGYGDNALRSVLPEAEKDDLFAQKRRAYLESCIASERRLQVAVELLDAGVIEENILTGICFWSPRARKHLGAPEDMVATHENFRNLLGPKNKLKVDNLYNGMINDHLTQAHYEGEHKQDPGSTLTAVFQVFKDDQGQPIRIIGVITRTTRVNPANFA